MSTTPPVLAIPGISVGLSTRLQDGLAKVDELITATVDYDDPLIADASAHLFDAGGKRVRPLLTLLAAELGTGPNPDVVAAAAGCELTHLASLYHDDVMDEADVRRGVPSANAKYDNSTAILIGDLLFGKASELVAGLGAEAVLIQARTFVRLCAGQIRDDRPSPPGVDPVEYYLGVLADKAGALIATSARYGAMFSGCSAETVDVITAFGERLGVAFQMADDLIDISSDGTETGKTPGTDLREGVATLAVLYARAGTDPRDARLRELLGGDLRDDARLTEALDLLRTNAALEQARERTRAVGAEAVALLGGLPESDAKTALTALVTSVVDRLG
ncbi:polyprenyl synthetase family protein [Lapillicoccus sp.]|uniref:polyprenyl synthetase family protein n=1 Tax=Lapillicoccus sp. TaxID=1909287 RepID=UPI0027CE968C|nr:polyprenyl synthetase family protein [Actinomycetota bacterium]